LFSLVYISALLFSEQRHASWHCCVRARVGPNGCVRTYESMHVRSIYYTYTKMHVVVFRWPHAPMLILVLAWPHITRSTKEKDTGKLKGPRIPSYYLRAMSGMHTRPRYVRCAKPRREHKQCNSSICSYLSTLLVG
jgi:hypothetical protein